MVADKFPFIGSRTAIGPLIGRASAAVYASRKANKAGGYGALALAAVSAVAASFLAERARTALAKSMHVPQQAIGVVEDLLVVGLAYAVSR
jgi:hypothetical protein